VAKYRKSGLDFVGDIAWGTHMCQFYKTKQDLIDVLVPYFIDGLKSNEFCVWVTSDFLTKEDATEAMQKALPNFSTYLKKGQIEIFPYTEWYLKEGKFELQRVLDAWVEKHDKALAAGYAGTRVTGNPFWIDNKKDWDDFAAYEAEINKVIDKYKLLVLCTYSLDKCHSDEIIDVVTNHEFGMIKRQGKWALIENSAHKQIEQALRKTETKFLALYASMTEGVAFHDIIYDKAGNATDYVINDVNPAFEEITGITREDAVGRRASELYGTGVAPFLDVYTKVVETGDPTQFETYFQPMEKHLKISCVCPGKGKFATVFHDISEGKKAQVALKRVNEELEERVEKRTEQVSLEREHLFSVLESLPVMVCLLTQDYHVRFINKLFRERFGESQGRPCYDYLFNLDEACPWCEAYGVLKTSKPHYWRLECPNGAIFDVYNSPFTDVDGSAMILEVDVDMTEQVKLEKQLKDTERLAAIGQTAGMVGHDIRNPLQAMMSDIYLLKDDLSTIPESQAKEGAAESIDSIEKNICYINKIVADLQDYARPLRPECSYVNLSELTASVLKTIELPDNIKLSVDIGPLDRIKTEPTYIRRSLTNLVNNSIQAMPNGGNLAVSAFEIPGNVVITVEDTGAGIPEGVKHKLFTPMMTTKSKGQGLGLAVVKRLIEALNGTIKFESQEGKGTIFTIQLPT
jgi:nitrogen-specific signal transduction histidine kinase